MIGRLDVLAAATAGAVALAGQAWAPEALRRTSAVGREVSLAAGPATVAGLLVAGAGSAALTVAVGAAGVAGLLDDLADPAAAAAPAPPTRGFAGHLAALRQGRVTTGIVKIVIIGLGSIAAAVLAGSRPGLGAGPGRMNRGQRGAQLLGDAVLIAATANLVNLFDTRPGRAGKAVLVGVVLAGNPPGVLGSLAATLPGDLGEHWMLGDTGANALGAALGLRVATVSGPARRAVWLAVVVALTVASERVSFGAVIDRHPVLRAVDGLGRTGRPPTVAGR